MINLRPRLELFFLALSFYTRIPSPIKLDYQRLPQATVYLPLVGCLLGVITASVFYLSHWLWPQPVAVVIALIFGVLLTGALHEDGFADVCDGFGGGWDKPQILAIMKDSRIGVYGALGLVLLFLLKASLLVSFQAFLIPFLFLAGHSISRLPPLLVMHRYSYARVGDSKAAALVYQPNRQDLVFASLMASLPLLCLPALCWLALLPVLAVNKLLGAYFYRQIGGYTGDCLGASQQVAEVVFYLSISALWTFI